MPSEQENVHLLLAMIKQIGTGGIDFSVIAQEINLPTAGAASKRWSRLRDANKDFFTAPVGTPYSSDLAPSTPTQKRTRVSTAKSSARKAASAKKASAKKEPEPLATKYDSESEEFPYAKRPKWHAINDAPEVDNEVEFKAVETEMQDSSEDKSV